MIILGSAGVQRSDSGPVYDIVRQISEDAKRHCKHKEWKVFNFLHLVGYVDVADCNNCLLNSTSDHTSKTTP